ncbi:MAG: UDP-N-acetylmuramoyl-L-alanyl-D-glutamate--2,6-diaminopimelate ligase [Actinomycetota bacterium]
MSSTITERSLAEIVRRVSEVDLEFVANVPDVQVSDITHDSRAVAPGCLFCCVRGLQRDGHEFASAAVERGAVALLVEHRLAGLDRTPQVRADDVRAAMGPVASEFFGRPSRHMTVVGITGTNGKTTTAHLLGSILDAATVSTEVIGTLTGTLTTPEATDLQRSLADMSKSGTRAVVMEVSSHALALDRVLGTTYSLAIFTNLGRDHLDFHGNQEEYFRAKSRLFEADLARMAVVNVDDPYGRRLLESGRVPTIGFSLSDVSDLEVTTTRHSYIWSGQRIDVGMGGSVNVMNSLAAATAARELGIDTETIAEGLRNSPAVAGRFEHIDAGQDFVVLVDFAHTPDGLAEVLRSVRQANVDGRVIVVFGCGGDRDKMKRPMMGETAASLADGVVVTSDNPRSEDPQAIIASIVAGIPDHLRHRLVGVQPDRRAAMSLAFRHANIGDVVIIAGKGHESTQTIGGEVLDFDDRVVARQLLETLR